MMDEYGHTLCPLTKTDDAQPAESKQPAYSAPFTTDVPQCCGDPSSCNDPCQPVESKREVKFAHYDAYDAADKQVTNETAKFRKMMCWGEAESKRMELSDALCERLVSFGNSLAASIYVEERYAARELFDLIKMLARAQSKGE